MNITALIGLILLVISMAVVNAGFISPPEKLKTIYLFQMLMEK
jgi:hypothetical protein